MALLDARQVGAKIRSARERKELRQDQLAERVGLYQSDISYFERALRTPTVEQRQRIADALDMDVAELIFRPAQERRRRRRSA